MANVVPKPPRRTTTTPRSMGKKTDKMTCSCCGQGWSEVDAHFYSSNSSTYHANNFHINICKSCAAAEYGAIVTICNGDELRALEYMCQRYGWYFDKDIAISLEISASQTLFAAYMAERTKKKSKLRDATYQDYLREKIDREEQGIEDWRDSTNVDPEVTAEMVQRWGNTFAPQDLVTLDEHYKMLHKFNPNCTGNQEQYIRDLCYANLLKMQALQSKDIDDVTKIMASYQKTFAASGLKMENETDESVNSTYGVSIAYMTQHTPEEYYKNKELFKDYSGIDDYLNRFVFRPIKNIVTGSKDRDEEFHVYGDMPDETDGDQP